MVFVLKLIIYSNFLKHSILFSLSPEGTRLYFAGGLKMFNSATGHTSIGLGCYS